MEMSARVHMNTTANQHWAI